MKSCAQKEMKDEMRVPRSTASGLPMTGLWEQMKLPISSLNNQAGILPFTATDSYNTHYLI